MKDDHLTLVSEKRLRELLRKEAALEEAEKALELLSDPETWEEAEPSDPVTGYFDPGINPHDFAATARARIQKILTEGV